MAKVSKGKYFTKIDLSKGYWQIPVAVEERKKLAFVTHQGMYQFKVMPFGVVNASAVFTRMMRRLLDGLQNTVNYIDDILMFSTDWDSHVELMATCLSVLGAPDLQRDQQSVLLVIHR
ncbi:putative polyprotein of retroviral origin [Apostichopus japonicus]|uniref:Putative polyprotein of retroviral origin n=1 Tax=Stichopus japonicus TaxID=307972 RepID=A0A2G8KEZ1_STIJA|nr:putative polyprotein of retroviral origin [Apostichopus japonicus]